MRHSFGKFGALVVSAALVLAACGGDDDDDDAATTTAVTTPATEAPTTTAAPEVLRILVTNDDGVGAPGIDALVQALEEVPDVEVTVVAPAENQSGTGDKTTPGGATATEATTASGHPATAVAGFPADSVNYALDTLLEEAPHVVVSGSNEGQHLGPVVPASGTIGAAATAARRGIPALAVSQGTAPEGSEPDYPASVEPAVQWVADHRAELLDDDPESPPLLTNLNAPTCVTGEVRGEVEAPVATGTEGRDYNLQDCMSTATDPADDLAAFSSGFVVVTVLDPDTLATAA